MRRSLCTNFRFEFKVSDLVQKQYKNEVTAETVDPKTGAKLGVIKIIPFESHLKRMSVVCEATDGEVTVFCKGEDLEFCIC